MFATRWRIPASPIEGAILQALSLPEIQEIELEILDEIHTVCQKLGIQYLLAYGSLLGAMRHKGFIPWDDDMDISMLRADYEVLVARFNEACSSDRFKLLIARDGVSNLPYAKVVDVTTQVAMSFVKECYWTGIWVDIFPLDFVNSSETPLLLREKALFYRRVFASSIPSPNRPLLQNLALKAASVLSGRENPVDLAVKLDECAQSHTTSETPYLCDIVGWPESPRVYKREWLDPVTVPFESREYFAPTGFEEILELDYGDWHTPPPEDKRIPHSLAAYRLT